MRTTPRAARSPWWWRRAEQEDPEDLDERLRAALAGNSVKDAAALVAVATGLPRKLVYARALALSR